MIAGTLSLRKKTLPVISIPALPHAPDGALVIGKNAHKPRLWDTMAEARQMATQLAHDNAPIRFSFFAVRRRHTERYGIRVQQLEGGGAWANDTEVFHA